MIRILRPAVSLLLLMTILTGVVYPLTVTAVAQVFYPAQAHGSLITVGETVIGSVLIGQTIDDARYFHGRPSVINSMQADEPTLITSSASNLGATNPDFAAAVAERDAAFRMLNGLDAVSTVPADMLYASGSGLDPHISPQAANLQAARVAEARGLDAETVIGLIAANTEAPQFGIFGESRVNVLLLNLALDNE